MGFVDGQNLAIEYCLSDGRYEQLPAMEAKAVTTTILIVFVVSFDTIAAELVSLADEVIEYRSFLLRCISPPQTGKGIANSTQYRQPIVNHLGGVLVRLVREDRWPKPS